MTMDKKIEADHKKDVNKTFSFDDVLTNELGQLGKYQVVIILIASLSIISSGYTGGEYLFTTARIPTRCLIPQCDSENPEYAPEWVLNAIPGTSTSSFENCERYQNCSLAGEGAAECPREWFDTTRTEPCDQYVYENKLSVVYDFGLACNEWKRSQIGSIQILGSLAGQLCTGYASDRWGRRAALVVNALNCAWLGLARSFVHSYEWFLSAKVLEAALGHSAFSSCYILVTEFFGPERRVIAGATISTIYALGQVVLAVAAHSVPAWRPLLRVLYAPPLLIVVYFWIMPESVRWLLSKGRYEESEVILKRIAKINKRPLSDKSLEALRATAVTKQSKETPKEPWLPIQVLRSRRILLLCIVSPVWWMTNTLVYFGLSINAVNISGNRYMNYALMALVEIPGYWTAILLLDRIGRKPVLIAGYWLCAATQFAFAFLSSGSFALSLTFYLFSKYAIATVVTSTYLYTAELFPTRYRHSLFAFSSMLGRLGGVAAPLTPALALTVWEHFPSVLFGSFALLAGLLVFLTPETLGVKLPDTMEDAERLGSHTRKLSLPS